MMKKWAKSTDFIELDLPAATLQDQWLRICDVHIETQDSHLTVAQQDSLKASPRPGARSALQGRPDSTQSLHWKAPIMEEYNLDGTLMTHDGRMYAVVNGEVALVQTFVFNPILVLAQPIPDPERLPH